MKLSELSIADLEAVVRLLAKEIYLVPCRRMAIRDAKIDSVKMEIDKRLGKIDFNS